MIVIADKPGQLGNMLLLFSHFIGRAIESGFTVSNPAFEDYAQCFPTTKRDLFCRFPSPASPVAASPFLRGLLYRASNYAVRALARLGGKLGFFTAITLYDWEAQFPLDSPEFLSLARSGRLILVRGWGFRDAETFRKHSDTIRDFFRPHEINKRNIDELISRARRDADILIGVHIRHGIIHFDNTRKYFYSAKRYAEMMSELVALFPGQRVSFLICSDWPQDPAMFPDLNVTFGTGDMIEDMYAFSRCDYLTGAPSTFTMWASFYGKVPLNLIRSSDQRQRLADFVILDVL
ncbi:MAG TPA: hypothetical protein VK582_14595 [Pyrinomonadaceae bacterium]|nr:hypothetical protein [Pyrinomonadaceae bacterium]